LQGLTNKNFQGPAGTDVKNLSLLNWDQNDSYDSEGNTFKYLLFSSLISFSLGNTYMVQEGFDSLMSCLAQKLDVRLNTVVKSINYSLANNYVEISTTRGIFISYQTTTLPKQQLGVFKAEQVIVTLPLGVLKQKLVKHYLQYDWLTLRLDLSNLILHFPSGKLKQSTELVLE